MTRILAPAPVAASVTAGLGTRGARGRLAARLLASWPAAPGRPSPKVHLDLPRRAVAPPALLVLPARRFLSARLRRRHAGAMPVLADAPPPDPWPRPSFGRRSLGPTVSHPLRVLASDRWQEAVALASRRLGQPILACAAFDPGEPSAPCLALVEPDRPDVSLLALTAGIPLLWPEELLLFGEAGLIAWTAREEAGDRRRTHAAQLAAMIVALLEEPAWRDRVALAQWDALLAAHDATAQRRLVDRLARAGGGEAVAPVAEVTERPRIVIEGSIGSSFSLAIVNRRLGLALDALGAEVELRSSEGEVGDFDETKPLAALEERAQALYRPPSAPMPAPWRSATLRLMYPPRADDFAPTAARVFSCYAWEETEFPRAWAEEMNRHLSLATAMSEHVAQALRAAGYRGPLVTVGCGVDHLPEPDERDLSEARRLLAGLPNRFTFLHVSAGIRRKGVDVLLEVWRRLAARDDWHANLVLKLSPHAEAAIGEAIATHGLARHPRSPVRRLDDDLTPGVMAALYRLADAIVQPSRCEGLGLPMAEGLLAGKAVIATSWSAHARFCTEATSWPIACRLEPARSHLSGWLSAWAEPDPADLERRMLEVRQAPPEEIARRAQAGQSILRRRHGWRGVAERTLSALRMARSPEAAVAALRLPKLGLVSTWNSRCGIADYAAKQVAAFPAGRLAVAANITDDRLGPDGPNVFRCWRPPAEGAAATIASALADCDAICVHFTYGLMTPNALGEVLSTAQRRGQVTLAVLHSTADRRTPSGVLSLASIADTLDACDMVLVHAIADLERLRGFGVRSAAMPFPHGFPPPPPGDAALPPKIARFLAEHEPVVASFGYLRSHKGVADLIASFPRLREGLRDLGPARPGLLLLNALYPSPDSGEELARCEALLAANAAAEDILLVREHLPEPIALAALARATLLAFPYRESLESSSASIRFGLASRRPVVATDIPIFADVAPFFLGLGPGGMPPAALAERLLPPLIEAWRACQGGPAGGAEEESASLAATLRRQHAVVSDHAWPRVAERFHDMLRGLVLDRRLGVGRAAAKEEGEHG